MVKVQDEWEEYVKQQQEEQFMNEAQRVRRNDDEGTMGERDYRISFENLQEFTENNPYLGQR